MLSRVKGLLRIVACTTLLVVATVMPVSAANKLLGETCGPLDTCEPCSTCINFSCQVKAGAICVAPTQGGTSAKLGETCSAAKPCEVPNTCIEGVCVGSTKTDAASAAPAPKKAEEFNCGSKNCSSGETCVVDKCEKNPPTFRSPSQYQWKEVGLGGISIPQIINGIIARLLPLVGALFLIMFMIGGFLYLTSNGEAKKVDQAKTTLINATIGVIIVTLAYFIISVFINMTSSLFSGKGF